MDARKRAYDPRIHRKTHSIEPALAPRYIHDKFGRGFPDPRIAFGAIAQLGERLNGIQEVRGSTPLGSTFSEFPLFFNDLVWW